MGVHNTNFYEVDGESKTNPAAAGLELNDADYSGVLQVNQWMHTNVLVAEIFCHPLAIIFRMKEHKIVKFPPLVSRK